MTQDLFSVPVYFIVFRECLEASIIVAVLLAFVDRAVGDDQVTKRRLNRQIWFGAGIGLLICLILGGAFIGAFYSLQKDIWGQSEELWECIFSIIATVIITIMGLALLRINRLKSKWQAKLGESFQTSLAKTDKRSWLKRMTSRYSMFILPFVTVLREGLECVVFVGGIGLSVPAKAFPIPVICGLLTGFLVGFLIYRGNRYVSIEIFLILSTWILYLVAAGLWAKAIGFAEAYRWNLMTGGDAAENGAGPGSYNIRWAVWHVNYGNPEIKTEGYGWQIFNAVLGWNNTGTYGTTIGYCLYWVAVTLAIVYLRVKERRQPRSDAESSSDDSGSTSAFDEKLVKVDGSPTMHATTLGVAEVPASPTEEISPAMSSSK